MEPLLSFRLRCGLVTKTSQPLEKMTQLMARSRSGRLRFLKGLQLEFRPRCPNLEERFRTFRPLLLGVWRFREDVHRPVPWREEALCYDIYAICVPQSFLFVCLVAA